MATMRCPNCSSEIQKPSSITGIVLGLLVLFVIGAPMFLIVCLAAISAVGSNADATFEESNSQIKAELREVDFDTSEFKTIESDVTNAQRITD